jgi:Ca2+/Na+ antiporter
MGIGNILGSNVFNIFILAIAQFVSKSFASVFTFDHQLIFLAILQILLLSFLLLALSQKKLQQLFKISLIPLLSVILYLGGMSIIF